MPFRFLNLALLLALIAPACQYSQTKPKPKITASRPQRSVEASLSPYIDLLRRPDLAWNARAPHALNLPISSETQQRRDALEGMLKKYAPRIWWHPSDPFSPMDPLEFVKQSSLWLRRTFGPDELISPRGQVLAAELGFNHSKLYARNRARFWGGVGTPLTPSGIIATAHAADSFEVFDNKQDTDEEKNFYLKYEDPTLGTGQTRDWDLERLNGGRYTASLEQGRVPLFWRLGLNAEAHGYGRAPLGGERVLIEFWYHVPYSHATSYIVGNHQGDWEGMAMLVDLNLDKKGALNHKLVAAFYAAHSDGRWHCPKELKWVDGHPEAFTALGSHATYNSAGRFDAGFITDETARGRAWETWHNLAPMTLEPYYGFAGHWGEVRWLPHTSGPTAPGARSKWLPNQNSQARRLERCT